SSSSDKKNSSQSSRMHLRNMIDHLGTFFGFSSREVWLEDDLQLSDFVLIKSHDFSLVSSVVQGRFLLSECSVLKWSITWRRQLALKLHSVHSNRPSIWVWRSWRNIDLASEKRSKQVRHLNE